LVYFADRFDAFAFRRGWTHGVLALLVLPAVVAAMLLAWDRWIPRRLAVGERARAGPLLALSAVAVASHPTLDWLNSYGMRWLMPFDGRWFYGDALFIIDPWVWLALGGALFLTHSRSVAAITAWGAFWVMASWLVWSTENTPTVSRAIWSLGVAFLWIARLSLLRRAHAPKMTIPARAALVAVATYAALAASASQFARHTVLNELQARGIDGIERVMVGPTPANPFAGDVVVQTANAYRFGRWRWLGEPRLALNEDRAPRLPPTPVIRAAMATPQALRFLVWSRFPYYEVESIADGGHVVRLRDARYRYRGRLDGPTVMVDRNLRSVVVE
jgi:inner membrane protein